MKNKFKNIGAMSQVDPWARPLKPLPSPWATKLLN